MEAYKIERLNKSYADKVIFDDLQLSISNQERILSLYTSDAADDLTR
ncbi:hypothetical protein NVR12_15070, partial [Staphylococcus pseudintermedius]